MDKIRKIKKRICCFINTTDGFVSGTFDNMINTFDKIIVESDIPSFLKSLFHAKQIIFFYIFLYNFYFLYRNTNFTHTLEPVKEDKNDLINFNNIFTKKSDYFDCNHNLKKSLYFAFILTFIVLFIFIIFLKIKKWDSQFIMNNTQLENYLSLNRKELEKNICGECKVTKVMRSFHCFYCNKCISRFEFHSRWFNICIGSQNFFIYLLILIVMNFYFFLSIGLLFYHIMVPRNDSVYISDFKGKYFVLHFWFSIIIYTEYKILIFSKSVYKNAFINLTHMERENWRKLPHMWKNLRKEYFNPFDKGIIKNFLEYYLSFRNIKKEFINKLKLDLSTNIINSLEKNEIILDSIKENKIEKKRNFKLSEDIISEINHDKNTHQYKDLATNENECLSDRNNNANLFENYSEEDHQIVKNCRTNISNQQISKEDINEYKMSKDKKENIETYNESKSKNSDITKLDKIIDLNLLENDRGNIYLNYKN